MRTDATGTSHVRAVRVFLAILATLAVGARALADESQVVDDPAAEIAAKAEASASELAASLRSLEGTLRTAAPVPENGKVLSAAENDALVEVGVKRQLAGLADALEQLSDALALGIDPNGERYLLENVARHAAALSQLGARPARVPIPPGVHTELLALWRDVEALSAKRAAAPPFEAAP